MSDAVTIVNRPTCDVCRYVAGIEVPAWYDAKTVSGPWANLCPAHRLTETHGALGTGFGQRLVTDPDEWETCSWCTELVPDDSLTEQPDGARICVRCQATERTSS